MSETAPKMHIYEKLRSRELTDEKNKKLGGIAVESLVYSAEKIAKVEKLRKFGRKITGMRELIQHREGIQTSRVEGLDAALQKRKELVREAKEKDKFARKGYSLRMKRFNRGLETINQERQLLKERGDFKEGNVFERIANSKERRAIHKEAKGKANQVISQREKDAFSKRDESRQELDNARQRRSQTRAAYWKSKAHMTGNSNNSLAVYKEVEKSQEDRIAALSERANRNPKYYEEKIKLNEKNTRESLAHIAELEAETAEINRTGIVPMSPEGSLEHDNVVLLRPSGELPQTSERQSSPAENLEEEHGAKAA